jgi:hypothetical protein
MPDRRPDPTFPGRESFPRTFPRARSGVRRGDLGSVLNSAIPVLMGFAGYGHGWFRTSDLSRVKRALSH